jgi:hypothetical protein
VQPYVPHMNRIYNIYTNYQIMNGLAQGRIIDDAVMEDYEDPQLFDGQMINADD